MHDRKLQVCVDEGTARSAQCGACYPYWSIHYDLADTSTTLKHINA